jgi:hypothetical protein
LKQRFCSLICQRIGQTYSGHQQSWAVHFSNLLLSCSGNSWCCTKRVFRRSLCRSPMSSAQCSPLGRILRSISIKSEITWNKMAFDSWQISRGKRVSLPSRWKQVACQRSSSSSKHHSKSTSFKIVIQFQICEFLFHC